MQDHLTALAREADRLTELLRSAPLDAPVRACPEWDVRALVAHLGDTHRWARNAIASGELRRDEVPVLATRDDVVRWYRSSADLLLAALRSAPAGLRCPTFVSRDGTVEFWARRQAHELAVHRWDVEDAAGGTPELSRELSADGVTEVLEVFVPRMQARGLLDPLQVAIRLERTDGDGVWLLGDGEPVGTARGTASDLLLVLWQRVSPDAVEIAGDAAAVREVLAQRLTP